LTDRVVRAFHDALEALFMSSDSEFYSVIPNALANVEAKARAEGKAESMAESLLTVLKARGFTLTEAQKERISGCRDVTQLQTWIVRAASVEAADELFG
jgi:hypothetical protein